MINYIDLFAGAGGLSEGFTQSGYHPVAHVEMNPEACSTLRTRECYNYLNNAGKIGIYRKYLRGTINRDKLYEAVPDVYLNSVINMTMAEENMQLLFDKIDSLMGEQSVKKIDLIIGGPPCQAYSLVGRAVVGKEIIRDPRNLLYKLYIQVLERYKPTMFVFENVPGLFTAKNGQYFQDIKNAIDTAGYELECSVLNAQDFGVLQNRRRVILIGWIKGSDKYYPEFKAMRSDSTVKSLFEDLPHILPGEEDEHYLTSHINQYLKESGIRKKNDVLTWHLTRPITEQDRNIYRHVINAWNKEKRRLKYTDLPDNLCTHKNRKAFLDRFKVVAADLPASQTMMAHISKDGHYFIHPDINQARSISVREAARIQSFPDDFFFEGSRTAAFTQIGNAVPPLMAKGIAKKLKEQLETK